MSQQGASLRPGDAATGGFLDATNATIKEARFVDSYPNGASRTLLRVTFQPEDGGKERTEYYSAGDPAKMKPSADGKKIVPQDARMHSKSGAIKFINSVIAGGFPETKLNDDISVFDGTVVFLRREAQPKTGNAEIDAKDRDLLLVKRVISLPEEGGAKAAKKPAAGAKKPALVKPTAAPAAAASDDAAIQAELEAIIVGILAEAPDNTVAGNKLGTAIFQAAMRSKTPNRGPLMKLFTDNKAFVQSADRPWAFADGNYVGMPAEQAEAA